MDRRDIIVADIEASLSPCSAFLTMSYGRQQSGTFVDVVKFVFLLADSALRRDMAIFLDTVHDKHRSVGDMQGKWRPSSAFKVSEGGPRAGFGRRVKP